MTSSCHLPHEGGYYNRRFHQSNKQTDYIQKRGEHLSASRQTTLSLPLGGRWHFRQKMPEGVFYRSTQFGLEKQPDYQLSAKQHTQINTDLEQPEPSLVLSPMIHNRKKSSPCYNYKRQSGEKPKLIPNNGNQGHHHPKIIDRHGNQNRKTEHSFSGHTTASLMFFQLGHPKITHRHGSSIQHQKNKNDQ